MDLEEMKLQNEIQNLKPKNSNMHKEIYLRKKNSIVLLGTIQKWSCGPFVAKKMLEDVGRHLVERFLP